jgi:hypothetical protein
MFTPFLGVEYLVYLPGSSIANILRQLLHFGSPFDFPRPDLVALDIPESFQSSITLGLQLDSGKLLMMAFTSVTFTFVSHLL